MTNAQDVIALRVTVCIAVMAAAIAALSEGAGSGIYWAIALVGFPLAFVVGYLTRRTRPLLLRIAQSIAAIGILVLFVGRIDHVTDLASLQIPLAQAFLWLLLLHALDTPNRRGLMVLLVSSLVLVSLAGVLSISMGIAPWVALWAFTALLGLLLAYRAELAELPALDGAPPLRFTPRAVIVPIAVLLAVLLVGFAVFMFVPVAGTNRALTFPSRLADDTPIRSDGQLINPSLGSGGSQESGSSGSDGESGVSSGYFGFSEELDTSLRGVRPDNTLVMRVRASAPDFWRGQTFDVWDGRVWRFSEDRPRTVTGDDPINVGRVPLDGPVQTGVEVDDLIQTYYLEAIGPNSIFAANQPTKVYFPERTIFQNIDGSLRAGVRLDPGSVYTVESQRALVTPAILRAPQFEETPPNILDAYATSPVTTDRVRELARRITAGAPTTYDKVVAIEQWLGDHTKYSLDIPRLPRGADAVDQYLFVDRRGFCEQIGTALVVMLRELGIPARLAVGYTPGERNPFTGLYEVRASDAHAWAEVYFPGIGWQGFDPTANVPLAGDSAIDGAGDGALDYLSARLHVPSELLLACIVLAGIAGLVVALRNVSTRPRRVRVSHSWASRQLARLEKLGEAVGRPRAPNESTPSFVRALGMYHPEWRADLTEVGRSLDAAMFGPLPFDDTHRAEIDARLTAVEDAWTGGRRGADLLPHP